MDRKTPHIRFLIVALVLGGVGRLWVLNAPVLAEGILLRLDDAAAMLAALVLGPLWGVVASLTATVGTPEPTYSGLLAAEVLIVGLLARRAWMPVLSATGFWLLVGAVLFADVAPSWFTWSEMRLLWAKQLVNGALSAVLAQSVAAWPTVRRWATGVAAPAPTATLRGQISSALIPLCLVPLLLLGLTVGAASVAEFEAAATRDLATRATTVASRLTDYMSAADGDVRTLAGELSMRPRTSDELQDTLDLHHAGSTVFLTMLVTDAGGAVLAATSRLDGVEPVRTLIGATVADRPYFSEPLRTGKPYRSEGFQGRAFRGDAIVAVSAPYVSSVNQQVAGIAQGALNLDRIGIWLSQFVPESEASVLVVDANGGVVASAGAHRVALLENARGLPWVNTVAAAGVAKFTDGSMSADPSSRPTMHVGVRQAVPTLGWQVFVRRPLRAIQSPVVPLYLWTGGWLVACLLGAAALAGRVAQWITTPIEMLAATTEAIGRGHLVAPPALPAGASVEVLSLSREVAAMMARLDQSRAELDQRVRDRTAELASATERNTAFFRAASDGMAVVSASSRIEEANEALCRMMGFAAEELVGTRLTDHEGATDRETRNARHQEIEQSGTSRFESVIRTKAGALVPVEVVMTSIAADGTRQFASIRDISERRRAEAERVRMESTLRQSQKMEAIGTLAGGIAHDFNNILMMISGSTDLALADVPEGHAARPSLARIARATSRAATLVRQILTFSRRRDDTREIVDIRDVVREATDLLRATMPAMIAITVDVDDGVPPIVADAVQLHQVLMNLGNNAAYAMEGVGGRLTVAARRAPRAMAGGTDGVVVSVSDTGTGMTQATIDRVFEPFFTTKPAGMGTGLGLAVAHGIIAAHGGTIEVSSVVGRGTTFRILLPAAPAGAATSAVSGASQLESARPPLSRPGHVLVVDDEPELVLLLCRQLERLGYTARGCAGPADVLAMLAAGSPAVDLVISDLAMPDMSGIELAVDLGRTLPGVAVILTSGRVDDDDRRRAARAGVVDILDKPFTVAQLADAVERALTARRETSQPT